MATIVKASGSPTITGTEYSIPAASTTLPTLTEGGFYSAVLDLSALVAGDLYELRVYEAATPGGTKQLAGDPWPLGPGVAEVAIAWPTWLQNGWDWTLKKLLGADHPIPHVLWKTF